MAATWSRGRAAVIAIVDTAAMPHSQERAIAHVTSLAVGSRISAGAYDDGPPTARPKYGSLNFRRRLVRTIL